MSREVANSWHWKVEHENGTGSAQSEINVMLHREHLGATLTCRVNSSAMESAVEKSVHIDMELEPQSLEMYKPNSQSASASAAAVEDQRRQPDEGNGDDEGFQERTVVADEGLKMSVTCVAKGAKPPAYVYWNSDPALSFDDIHEEVSRESNGLTFTTTNRLTFQAQRKLTSLSCFASNQVLDQKHAVHLKRTTTINVKFRPEIVTETPGGPRPLPEIRAVQGETVELVCRFAANPTDGAVVHWYKDGYQLVLGPEHHQELVQGGDRGGSVLRLDAGPSRRGVYACSAENEVGRSQIVEVARLKVEVQPLVDLVVFPRQPVSELQNTNVTLVCRDTRLRHHQHGEWNLDHQGSINNISTSQQVYTSGSYGDASADFLGVKWYLDGELLKHVVGWKDPEEPEQEQDRQAPTGDLDNGCDSSSSSKTEENQGGDRCSKNVVDPSKIILVNVKRTFHGNYSCRAKNRAGWGPMSSPKEIRVLYSPSGTRAFHEPIVVLKDRPLQVNIVS